MRTIFHGMLFPACAVLPLLAVLHTYDAHAEPAGQIKPETLVFKKTQNAKGQPVELVMQVFKPEGWSAKDKRPAIVFFFGGGWVSGNTSQFFPQCRDLTHRGMVTISAEYRIKSKHGTPPQACVEDGKSAIRYVRQNAAKLGIDPGRIAAGGGSAGGHVAAATGLVKGFEAKDEDKQVSSVPDLLVLFNPVIDTSVKTGYGGKRLGDDAERLSPLHQVSKTQPPSIIVHGDKDTTVPIDSVRRFEKRSRQVGASCVLYEFEGAGHGFFNHETFRKPKPGATYYYPRVMEKVEAYLERHGYLTPASQE